MKYRFYSFVNHLYMNEKQWGIQTAHAVSTMAVSLHMTAAMKRAYKTWAVEEPTIIMCQGGNVAMLTELHDRLSYLAAQLGLAEVKFHEDEQSLGGVITCVAVLVPEIYFECTIESEPLLDGTRAVVFVNEATGKRYRQATNPVEHEFLSIVKLARLA